MVKTIPGFKLEEVSQVSTLQLAVVSEPPMGKFAHWIAESHTRLSPDGSEFRIINSGPEASVPVGQETRHNEPDPFSVRTS